MGAPAEDLEAIQNTRARGGLPYQTLIASLLHEYASRRLREMSRANRRKRPRRLYAARRRYRRTTIDFSRWRVRTMSYEACIRFNVSLRVTCSLPVDDADRTWASDRSGVNNRQAQPLFERIVVAVVVQERMAVQQAERRDETVDRSTDRPPTPT